MNYTSFNPYSQQLLSNFDTQNNIALNESENAFVHWKKLTIAERVGYFEKLIEVIQQEKENLANLVTAEMGKPLCEAIYEIDKTIATITFYNENAANFLAKKTVKTAATESYVCYEPLGVILAVMPWNFPIWQVFRFAIPTLLAGNVAILKHANNVPQCAAAIENLFTKAGFPNFVFKNYFLSNEKIAELLKSSIIKGLSFTGSVATGSYLASLAAASMKKSVTELGGNDAFIVLPDADIDWAVQNAIKSRAINSGQSCNAAKRFIIHELVYTIFKEKLIEKIAALKVGDPLDEQTNIGPLARIDLAEKVKSQIEKSVAQGAQIAYQQILSSDNPYFVAPTVLSNIRKGIVAFDEEIFGPVWSLLTYYDINEAIALSNDTVFGLGCSIWSEGKQQIDEIISQIEAGNVFVNEIVKSDPKIPFGGIKASGLGRELGEEGIKEFTNIKTVFIK